MGFCSTSSLRGSKFDMPDWLKSVICVRKALCTEKTWLEQCILTGIGRTFSVCRKVEMEIPVYLVNFHSVKQVSPVTPKCDAAHGFCHMCGL